MIRACFLPLGLSLARHGVLESFGDRDVADLHGAHRNTPSLGLAADFVAQPLVGRLEFREQGREHRGPIISRKEVWAMRSMAVR